MKWAFMLIALLCSCKTREGIRVETQYRDSIITRHIQDSIYLETKDSVFVYSGKDTFIVERFKVIYKDRIKIRLDTVHLDKGVKLEESRFTAGWFRGKIPLYLLIFCILIFLTYKTFRK